MDWRGVLLLVVAVGCVLTAFNEAGKVAAAPWALVAALLAVGIVAFVAFWKSQDASPHPLVPTVYLRSRATWALLGTTVLTMTGVFAIMNGIIPAIAQDEAVGAGIAADVAPLVTLTPYALAGLVMGPIAGKLAGTFGYRAILRVGLIGTVAGLIVCLVTVTNPTGWLLLGVSVFVGITYAGIANIMLNGLGIVLSPADNPGYLPGLNAGAFNLGAGLSFAVLFAVKTALDASGPSAGYSGAIIVGAVFLGLAFLMSLLIPKPAGDKA
jgi:MFS family permease